MARIGDVVTTFLGEGRVVRGSDFRKPPARGGKWVFLFHPKVMSNRVICFHPSEVTVVPAVSLDLDPMPRLIAAGYQEKAPL